MNLNLLESFFKKMGELNLPRDILQMKRMLLFIGQQLVTLSIIFFVFEKQTQINTKLKPFLNLTLSYYRTKIKHNSFKLKKLECLHEILSNLTWFQSNFKF